ncbi:Ankyrin repeat-containing domain [Pseudocohnilembus persalinus]|uniref:Ankyrin repeat-containing domain n=1 Tax=Pseudocohnilembus persalinus TaxID=266149 RepID=A0A0V0QL72_PSEPJ|nr:Ankyrin repeat-containing domain [Pseudocohnilembus persalinus]|eukprot:KRX02887.1 Ankyrin repeat-containing domain [Pseudocohnilembus persalinus]
MKKSSLLQQSSQRKKSVFIQQNSFSFSQSSDSDNNDIIQEVNSQNNNFNQNKQNYLMVLIENLCEKTQNFNQIQLRKICDIYKIDFKKLQELETREKKEDYIFDCMQNAIDSDVLKLNQIIDQHEHEYKIFLEKVKKSKKMQDPDLQADIDIRNVQNSDMEWMNIKTNHYPIQFYLKQILLQELEKDQNRKNVEKFEKTAQNIKKEKVNQFSEPAIDQNYEEIMAKIIWNKEYEQQFLQAKQETRHRTKAIGTTNQQVISAITPIVRSMNIEPNDKKYRFKQYYSSGPQNKREYKSLQKEYSNQAQNAQTTYENENLILNPHKNHQWITKDIENQAALKIQKGFKNFLLQKKCKACIKEIQNMKIQDVSKKVQIYVKNTQLFQNQDHSEDFQSKIIQTDKKIRKNSNKRKSTLISSKQNVSALKKQKSLTNNFIQNSNFTQNINTTQNQHSNLTSAMKQKNAYKMSRQQNGAKQIKFASVQFQSEKNLINNSDVLSTPSHSIATNNYYNNNNQFENQLNNSSQQQKDIINAYNINIQNTEPDSIKFQSNIIPQNQNKINSLNISQISHIEIPVSAFKSNQNSTTKLINNKSISSKQYQSQKINPHLKNNQSDNEWYMKKISSMSAITTQATSQNISSVNSLQRKQSVDQKLDHLKQKYSVKDKEEKQKILNQYWKKRQKNFDQAEENQNILKVKHQKLFKAAMQSNYQLLLELVQQGFDYEKRTDVCRKDLKGNTPLHYVVSKNNIDFVMWLLEKNADVNIQNKNGNTPLHIAFRNRDVEVISRLIEYGGDLNIQNNLHLTPVAYGGMDTFQQLGLENAKIRFSDQNSQLSQFDNNKLVKIFEHFDNQIIKQKEIELLSEPLFYQHRALQHGLDDIKGEIPFIQVNVTKSFGGQDKIKNEIISDKQYEQNVSEYQQKLKNQEKQRQLLERFV